MRTRARAQQGNDEPNDATTDATERAPMTEISPNASPELVNHEELHVKTAAKTPAKTPAEKAKGKSRAKKGKKGKAVEEEEQAEAAAEEEQAAAEPEAKGAAEDPTQDASDDVAQVPTNNERPATPPAKTVRLTRRQQAKLEEEQKQTQRAASPPPEPAPATEEEVLEALVKTAEQEAIADKATEDTHGEVQKAPAEQPARLTRRQQAKLEEEQRQTERAASPHPAPEATTQDVSQTTEEVAEEEVATDIATEDADAGAQEVHATEIEEELLQEVAPPQPEELTEEAKDEPLAETEAPQETMEAQDLGETQTKIKQVEEPYSKEYNLETPTTEVEPFEPIETEHGALTPSVEITSEPEPKTLASEQPTEDVATPLRSHTSSRRASRSPSKSPMRLEESFEAIDALEEALENVTSVGSFSRPNIEESPMKENFLRNPATPNTRSKTPKKAPVPTAKVSRTPTVAAPKSLKPVKSSIARASGVRVAPSKEVRKPSTETVDYLASKRRPVSVSFPTPPPPPKGRAPTKPTFQLSSNDVVAKLKAQKEERQKHKADGVVPKPRPISMPPPPKSSKPLTKPTFQLPGEKVAEKLKAQKEERQRREAEPPQQTSPKQRPVSISTVPYAKSSKPPTKATFELPGAAVAEKLRIQKEERQKRIEEASEAPQQQPHKQRPSSMHMAPHVKSSKAPTKATFELPGAAVADKLRIQKEERLKRMEEAEAAKKEAALKARQAFRKPVQLPTRTQQRGLSIPPPQQQRSTSLASKRSSMSLSTLPLSQSRSTSTSSANRQSVLVSVQKAVVTPVDALQQKIKGREVFNRDKLEKEARERERREKEDAAKRARAEAAERGRIASREWAEKQRRKMMGV